VHFTIGYTDEHADQHSDEHAYGYGNSNCNSDWYSYGLSNCNSDWYSYGLSHGNSYRHRHAGSSFCTVDVNCVRGRRVSDGTGDYQPDRRYVGYNHGVLYNHGRNGSRWYAFAWYWLRCDRSGLHPGDEPARNIQPG